MKLDLFFQTNWNKKIDLPIFVTANGYPTTNIPIGTKAHVTNIDWENSQYTLLNPSNNLSDVLSMAGGIAMSFDVDNLEN